MNAVAIFISVLVQQAIGAVYYGILGGAWAESLGKTRADFEASAGDPIPYLTGIISSIFLSLGISWIFRQIGIRTLVTGIRYAILFFLFFSVFVSTMHTYYAHLSQKRLLIDSGYDFLVFLVAGAIIGAFPKKEKSTRSISSI
ncbi:DUF1761 domain-containing protein [Leptospira ilyithenensis]|uniref:DUF1761 domain-containing protein n=1 Tax=Leptospira ilyithenensis TaxID=2484901 RepID=A0A4R9LNN9_9LEPT|nr:DUF1761 domain-containing protein [Leptospira ilyithenensis]TGN10385.1 DUF1761 domain-containing protein [Leptospira ilyithenensis]